MSEKKKRIIKCVVPGCSNDSKNRNDGFLNFPVKDPDLRQKWIKILCLEDTKLNLKYQFVCKAHFAKEDILTKKLKEGSFPTQNLPVRQFPHQFSNKLTGLLTSDFQITILLATKIHQTAKFIS